MAHIIITIVTDNAAFEIERGEEVGRILRELADRFQYSTPSQKLRDINGNTCGNVQVKE